MKSKLPQNKIIRSFFMLFIGTIGLLMTGCFSDDDCYRDIKFGIQITTEGNIKSLEIQGMRNWAFIIFENVNEIKLKKCYNGIEFLKNTSKGLKIIMDTSAFPKSDGNPFKIVIVGNKNEANKNDKIYLEKNKKYGLYFIPHLHSTPIFYFIYDSENVKLVE